MYEDSDCSSSPSVSEGSSSGDDDSIDSEASTVPVEPPAPSFGSFQPDAETKVPASAASVSSRSSSRRQQRLFKKSAHLLRRESRAQKLNQLKLDVERSFSCDDDALIAHLKHMYAPATHEASIKFLKSIRMSDPGRAFSDSTTASRYIEEFTLARAWCINFKGSDRLVCKLFCAGINPFELRSAILNMEISNYVTLEMKFFDYVSKLVIAHDRIAGVFAPTQ